jgi:plastocyanin
MPLSAIALFALVVLPQAVFASVVQVRVLDDSFLPQTVTVQPGDTVVWTNYGSVGHTVAADSGMFMSNTLNPGVNFSYTFNTPGTYAYHDQSYGSAGGAGMAGTVTVGGGVMPTYTTTVTNIPATGASASALQAQAQALLQEISQLQAQLSSSGSSSGTVVNSSSCPNIGRILKLGSSGVDVSRLQTFLAQDPSVYPEAQITGYFGVLTQAAVQRWQVKYNIVSSGTPTTTGWGVVGPRTAAAIALLCSTGSTTGSAVNTAAPTVGGVMQVTPTSGAAPLTVSVQATVNTTGSCTGATYVLNFGDGGQSTAIPIAPGTCQPVMQTLTHTYSYGGTYTIVLAAGTHQTTALVTVSGPPSPQQAAASGIPSDSLSASLTSGVAPLTVVFTGTVSSLSSYGCSGTCTDTINFGDGQIGLVQLPTAAGSWQSYVIDHTYTAAGTYTAQLNSVTGAADGPPITITVGSASTTTAPAASGGSYGIITLTPNVGGNPLAVNAMIALPSCASYQIHWGDSSAISTQTAACAAGGTTITASHTYAAGGSYTVSLDDGNGNVQASAGVSISN